MPTGYTAAVVDGTITDLPSFALQCARGMGALIMMRDEPWDAPIPERFEPSTYHAERLKKQRQERDRIANLTDLEADAEALAEYEAEQESERKYLANKGIKRERYKAMIALVEPWERAPEGLKEFMLEQLRSGMDFDCPEGRDTYWKTPTRLTGVEWRATKMADLHRDIERCAIEDGKEQARTEARNVWIAQLRAAILKTKDTSHGS